jgi:hypothetical protein
MTFGRMAKFAITIIVLLVAGMAAAPSAATIQISDVFGLANSLAVRPTAGAGYSIGRTAIINAGGQVDAAAGNLGDCVHVDGSSGSCGLIGSVGSNFVDNETPQGNVNGVNQTYLLQNSPNPPNSLHLYANGIRLSVGSDYVLAANRINFLGLYVPGTGDIILADYRY